MGREAGRERRTADGDAAAGEERAQAVERTAHAFLRGVFGDAERCADFAEVFVFEITQEERGAVGLGELLQHFVEERLQFRPDGGSGFHVGGFGSLTAGDFHGGLLAGLASRFVADDVDGGAAGDDVQPRDERGGGFDFGGAAREIDEDGLCNLLGERAGADLPACGGIDQVEVTADEFREGGLRAGVGVLPEQVVVTRGHLSGLSAPRVESDRKSSSQAKKAGRENCEWTRIFKSRGGIVFRSLLWLGWV